MQSIAYQLIALKFSFAPSLASSRLPRSLTDLEEDNALDEAFAG
jgi:hypothetical protein